MIYLFEATYENMITLDRFVRTITIDAREFCNEKEVYIAAMTLAYMKKSDDEDLSNIEFIGC